MIKHIIMFLFVGFAWGQANLDKLVLKDGTTYLGEYSKIERKTVFFKPQGAFGFQPIPVKRIDRLELKDGRVVVLDGKDTHRQKLSAKAKNDAKSKNLNKWALYGPLSGLTFWGCASLYQLYDKSEWWGDSSIFLGGSSAASLTIPHFVLNKEEKFTYPESITDEDDKLYYKQFYSNKLKQRKFKYIVGSTLVTGAVVVSVFFATFSLNGFDACFDPRCG
ncbi:MAG: hypothetical protein HOA15_07905 [Candidatus Marinimicrobia bacterium]|jgi:hypothetical protein|nr:hypothetical protein [Candidatus Neomarinimicrobiota bacterium]MBT3675778.1 hypothetical protein [Candidatus Neomarinimicrobiota bacterium]MBT4067940.1 hypothetical protein [Candidatus Neomarinimicrobiota bacterium]MBT4270938.1 hypothetical protein [Candidatus Neomarinimicrobiota bacterium]MBT5175775.1 hypothetical protein [Candidatus Neomarinimicrobiota bacterium]